MQAESKFDRDEFAGKILVLRNLIFGNVDTQYQLDNAIIGPVYLSATELDGFIGK